MREDEVEINQVYDLTASKYYEARNSTGTIHNTFIANPAIRNLITDVRGKRMLDIGCGFGEDIKHFSKRGAKVTGLELNRGLIKIMKDDPKLEGIEIVEGSIYSLDFKEPFDICLANLVLDQVRYLDNALKEVNKVLKKG